MADARASLKPVERIDRLHISISGSQRELLRAIAEFDSTGHWRADGARDMAQWLSGRLGITTWDARRWVAAGHALENLPRIAGALENGTLCLDKVVELTRFATPESEQQLLAWARRVTAATIRHRADRANRPEPEEVKSAERDRSLRWWWFDDNTRMGLQGEFPAAEGAAIAAAISRLADKLPQLPREEMYPGFDGFAGYDPSAEAMRDQRRADALYVLAAQAINDDADADRATVVVHTTLGRDGFSELENGPVLSDEVARRLSCDARLQFVLTDAEGNALGIGRASRGVPPWLMRELCHRDRGCTFPGCGTRAYLKAHHIRHWEEGGATDLDNLVCVCHFHHKLVHEFGWDVRLHGSVAQWYRPTGKRYEPGPDPPAARSICLISAASRPGSD